MVRSSNCLSLFTLLIYTSSPATVTNDVHKKSIVRGVDLHAANGTNLTMQEKIEIIESRLLQLEMMFNVTENASREMEENISNHIKYFDSKVRSLNDSIPRMRPFSLLPDKFNVSVDAILDPFLKYAGLTFITLSVFVHLITVAMTVRLSLKVHNLNKNDEVNRNF